MSRFGSPGHVNEAMRGVHDLERVELRLHEVVVQRVKARDVRRVMGDWRAAGSPPNTLEWLTNYFAGNRAAFAVDAAQALREVRSERGLPATSTSPAPTTTPASEPTDLRKMSAAQFSAEIARRGLSRTS